jgi:hypothetical protein
MNRRMSCAHKPRDAYGVSGGSPRGPHMTGSPFHFKFSSTRLELSIMLRPAIGRYSAKFEVSGKMKQAGSR